MDKSLRALVDHLNPPSRLTRGPIFTWGKAPTDKLLTFTIDTDPPRIKARHSPKAKA